MSKKILLAAGCSYTANSYISFDKDIPKEDRNGWSAWPELMATELNLKCVNNGRSGSGSADILKQVMKGIAIYGNRIDTVAVLWSCASRESFYTFTFNALAEIDDDSKYDTWKWMDDIDIGKINKTYWNSNNFDKHTYENMLENQLCRMLAVIDICKAHNIKLVMAQGLGIFNYFALNKLYNEEKIGKNTYITKKEYAMSLMSNPFFSKLEENKDIIIGWPFIPLLGGSFLDLLRYDSNDNAMEKYYISEKDRHPNGLGHELFSKAFITKYREFYD